MTKLAGRVALITGAASGMGDAHARILAAEGAAVAVCDIDEVSGRAVAAEVGGAFYRLDVTSDKDWEQALSAIAAQLGPVTILVNNAGVCPMNPVQDATTDEWNLAMAVNASGTFFGMRGVTPQMAAAGGGVIVNISSSAALSGLPGVAAYTAAKWAVRGLTKAAARDLACHGIRVLSLHPALVRTPMSAGVDLVGATAHYPIARPAEPEEIARMLLFMVTEATYSTGSEFVADGGSAA